MKKTLFVLMLALMLVFSGCNGSGSGGGGGSTDDNGLTAYERLTAANEAYENANSMSTKLKMEMVMAADGESMAFTMDGSMAMVMENEESLQMAMEMTADYGTGEAMDIAVYYLDGYMYMNSMGQKLKFEAPYEQAMEQATASNIEIDFDETAIKDQSVDGNKLYFTIDGSLMTEMFEASMGDMMALFGGEADVSYKDIEYTIILNNDGTLDSVEATTSAAIAVMDESITMDIQMNMTDITFDSVTVPYPVDLEEYTEIDANMMQF